MEVHIMLAAQQAHAGNKANQPKIMVAMEVRNKNMIDTAAAYAVFGHLHLCAFSAINQKQIIIQRHYLGSRMTVKSR